MMKGSALYLIPIELAPKSGTAVLGLQVKDTIRNTNLFFVENVRTARRFISSLQLGLDISSLQFFELSKHTEESRLAEYLQMLRDKPAGIMSEAGCPGVADPGAKLVAMAHDKGITVCPLVGPGSFLLALMGSGMNGQQFTFHGYLPIDKVKRKQAIIGLEKLSLKTGGAQIFMETPYRNGQLLKDILSVSNPHTKLCLACNLTGPDQIIQTKTMNSWKKQIPDIHKQPTVFIIQR